MTNTDPDQQDFWDRAPATRWEKLHSNCRPQPAIPSLFVFLVCVLLPVVLSRQPGNDMSWIGMLVAAGILGSCGLAVAAGFCSVFPQLMWIIIAGWCLTLPDSAALTPFNRALLGVGILCAAAMLGYQLWRVRSGQFIPTIREYKDDMGA